VNHRHCKHFSVYYLKSGILKPVCLSLHMRTSRRSIYNVALSCRFPASSVVELRLLRLLLQLLLLLQLFMRLRLSLLLSSFCVLAVHRGLTIAAVLNPQQHQPALRQEKIKT
jgi:hypothetical protein